MELAQLVRLVARPAPRMQHPRQSYPGAEVATDSLDTLSPTPCRVQRQLILDSLRQRIPDRRTHSRLPDKSGQRLYREIANRWNSCHWIGIIRGSARSSVSWNLSQYWSSTSRPNRQACRSDMRDWRPLVDGTSGNVPHPLRQRTGFPPGRCSCREHPIACPGNRQRFPRSK